MSDKEKSKADVLTELDAAHRRIAELEAQLNHYTASEETQGLEFYRTIFEQSPLGIIATNLNLEIIEVNKKICQMLGYSVSEFKALKPSDFTHPDDNAPSTQLVKRLYDGELDFYQLEKRYIRKDGSVFWAMLSVALVRDEHGQVSYSIGMVEDINERKEAQQKLQASETRYRDLVDDTLVGVISSTVDGEILYVNNALLQMLEYDSLEDYKIGGALPKYKNPEDRDKLIQTLKQSDKVKSMELEGYTKYGREIFILISATLDKAIINFTLVDITERKKAQVSLQEERNLLMTIIDNLPVDIYVKDLESRFVLANESTMKTLRVSTREEYIGKNDYDFMPHDPQQARENITVEQRITETGDPLINEELSGIDPDGQRRWNLTSKIPLRDTQGKITGIVGIGMDITDKKLAEKAIQAALEKEQQTNALKDRFMAMVSHEFRTPLAIIATSNQLLDRYHEQLSPEKREEYLRRIEGQVTHLNNMIENINIIMRNEVDPLKLNLQPINVKDLCQNVVQILQGSIAVEHKLKFYCEEGLGVMMADKGLLRLVISNLLSNSIKYSPAGTEIILEMLEEDNWRILRVRDYGIGISPEDVEHLFDAYHRGQNVENIKGIGLGLKIVKDFVELHHGHIEVESTVGEGATFTVSIPLDVTKEY